MKTTEPNNHPLEQIELEGERYFKIADSDAMRPFFMSIVSDSNHWMFISSNGGLTAGRKNANFALFPYYTDDKITESAEITGPKSLFRVEKDGATHVWEPSSERASGIFKTSRNLYKNLYGNKIVFEEVNHDLGLRFSYQWNSSNAYGFVRKSRLVNDGNAPLKISLLDGIQNILPYGVGSDLQNRQSNLVDAYKRSELLEGSGLGIYALSAIIVDKAEPSEALKANIAWSLGLENPARLLSSLQLPAFRKGVKLQQETDVKAEKGAYLLASECTLAAGETKEWLIVANVNQDHAAIAALDREIREDAHLQQKVLDDIDLGTRNLIGLCAASDGLQCSSDSLRDTRHFSNTLFNIMRGGIFDDSYQIEKWDFENYLKHANRKTFDAFREPLQALPGVFSLSMLKDFAHKAGNPDLKRLALEYLPLKFSRRHGDPSRPWNAFSINTRSEVDGSKILDYEGNWRDIFQNWEALAHSYPDFIDGMIQKFLNASTFDGYNPYRVTKDGFDWEVIEPDDPWSYIGYWGDHQIIYLLKFLEFSEKHFPGRLNQYLPQEFFVYANVPYRIKSYEDLLRNPKDTILFDEHLDRQIRRDREAMGADGALLRDQGGAIYRVNLLEKLLATLLAKLSNFIPEGGIWMNTQRPEWNDANNALVGNGVSMVTLYYLRRFMVFFRDLLETAPAGEITISAELHSFFEGVYATLRDQHITLSKGLDDKARKRVLDGLGQAGSAYRQQIYEKAFTGKKRALPLSEAKAMATLCLEYLEQSIRANRRPDALYHAYNLMTVEGDDRIHIEYLTEMLEGQVAVLSSGYLSARESLDVLDGLKASRLFREDQYSYLLYPNKDLPGFFEKNTIPKDLVAKSALMGELLAREDRSILVTDVRGEFHFNGNFKNAADLKKALDALPVNDFTHLNEKEKAGVLEAFETVFNHKEFTGRSGTFYGYEGLGSIYWHMVSKLQLAVQESCLQAIHSKADASVIGRLLEHYYEINAGIGVHKPPSLYGAFPTDPYSHTPMGKGAQQPGMTGQVKEDILSRFGELGLLVEGGDLRFHPYLLRKEEFLREPCSFSYVDLEGTPREVALEPGSLFFTCCQVPVIYRLSAGEGLEILMADGSKTRRDTLSLDRETSRKIFYRTGEVQQVVAYIEEEMLK
ncbi:hypothetical protein [Robiginitalea marina]|uniref:Cellobiose phosphorylase n=1 Tax=Robiginitalea marina TaxID=2954105 RepID=A0ABT1AY44_9FLAO|nr:hypothetical protein [Robiginitalea marina]MCO5724138.1 hypothetical protein [Robiginitalea marina]